MAIINRSRHSRIEIDLAGPQGNAFCLLTYARQYGHSLGMPRANVDQILKDMRSGDYEHLIKVFDDNFGTYIDLIRQPQEAEA